MIELILPGKPVPYSAPRVMRSFRKTYNPREKEKTDARLQLKQQYTGPKLDGPIILSIEFRFPIPDSFSKSARKRIQENDYRHTKKPDIDNCIKFALDALKGIVLVDDNQVDVLWVRKIYSENPSTVIRVMT